jgi:sugar lactone lactonase YvrE
MSLLNVLSRVLVFPLSGERVSTMKRLLCGLVVLGLFSGVASQAWSQYLYWSDAVTPGDIRRANLDGSEQVTLVSGLVGPIGPTLDLAGGQMYWADTQAGDIQRANLDGSGQTTLVSGLPAAPNGPSASPPALDLAHGQMYWTEGTNSGPGAIRRANLDGSEQTTLVTGLSAPRGVALDLAGGMMYWADNNFGDIRRANLDGSGTTTILRGLPSPDVVALDLPGGKMYWTDSSAGEVLRANLDGSGKENLVSNQNRPISIALDLAGGKMYWGSLFGGDIRRANLDGSGQEVLITGLNITAFIALDLGAPGTAAYFALAAPASVPAGTPFDVILTALDPYGNTAFNCQSTVTFSTSDTDPGIVLPTDYTFTAADAGVHTFTGGVTLSTPGDQTITVTDTASGITRGSTVTVVPPG